MSTRAVVIERPGKLALCEVADTEPGPGEAKVRIAYAGICGSDRDLLAGSRPPGYVRYPVIPGHEWSGIVTTVGSDVSSELVGQPVVGEGFRACGSCDACRSGDTTLCAGTYEETGFTQPGAWTDHLVLPAELLHVLPRGSDLRSAAGLEPAACAAQAVLVGAPSASDRVAVVGGGTIGLLATQLLAASEVRELTVVDLDPSIAALARRCGATSVSTQPDPLEGQFDLVIEAAGAVGTAELATRLARRGGRVVLLGIPDEHDRLPTSYLVTANLTILTVFGAPRRAWDLAVVAFGRGDLDPGVLVTHEMSIADVADAFQLLENPPHGLGKILLRP